MTSRFLLVFRNFVKQVNAKNELFSTNLLNYFIFLFFGLFFGSLFGTFLDFPRSTGLWDGCLICLFLLLTEAVNFFVYSYQFEKFKHLNYLKLGVLFAIFIDAFKVGS
jgi:hypothetical protein